MSLAATQQRKPEAQRQMPQLCRAKSGGSRHSKKKQFWLLKFSGMGCKSISVPPSAPAVIWSAAEWEARGPRGRNQKRKKGGGGARNPENVAVDVADACCAPPGIGFSSARKRNPPAPRLDRGKHPREARRAGNRAGSALGIDSSDDQRSADGIIEMLMSQQALLTGRSLCYDNLWAPDDGSDVWFEGSFGRREPSDLRSISRTYDRLLEQQDPYHEWRLDLDEMSYEELLDMGDRIGYVGTGLREEEIPGCLRITKHFNNDLAASFPGNDGQRDWKCSICQEKYATNKEIGVMECGHHHHVDCIKQWLLKKNSCPICKCAAMQRKTG